MMGTEFEKPAPRSIKYQDLKLIPVYCVSSKYLHKGVLNLSPFLYDIIQLMWMIPRLL